MSRKKIKKKAIKKEIEYVNTALLSEEDLASLGRKLTVTWKNGTVETKTIKEYLIRDGGHIFYYDESELDEENRTIN